MSEETLFEQTDRRDRHETATFLRQLADAFDDGAPLWFAGDDAPETPDELDFEVELEQGIDDDVTEYELEVEAEWDDRETADEAAIGADAESVAADASERDDTETQSESDIDEATTESGGAVPPVDPADEAERDETANASLARFELFQDRADEWRWRLVHRNGNIIASSGEGYTRRANAEKGLRSVMRNAPGAAVVRADED